MSYPREPLRISPFADNMKAIRGESLYCLSDMMGSLTSSCECATRGVIAGKRKSDQVASKDVKTHNFDIKTHNFNIKTHTFNIKTQSFVYGCSSCAPGEAVCQEPKPKTAPISVIGAAKAEGGHVLLKKQLKAPTPKPL